MIGLGEDQVFRKMEALATCLCNTLNEEERGELCFCGILPGQEAIIEYLGLSSCKKKGMAWVRLVTSYPTLVLGQPNQQYNNCSSMLGFDIEVGVARPATALTVNGKPPTAAQQLRDAAEQLADLNAMRRAILCCDLGDVILGNYQPDSDGGVIGGTWLVAMDDSPMEWQENG